MSALDNIKKAESKLKKQETLLKKIYVNQKSHLVPALLVFIVSSNFSLGKVCRYFQ